MGIITDLGNLSTYKSDRSERQNWLYISISDELWSHHKIDQFIDTLSIH